MSCSWVRRGPQLGQFLGAAVGEHGVAGALAGHVGGAAHRVDGPTRAQAHAVVIPDPAITSAGRDTMRNQLLASGFASVTILSAPAVEPGMPAARVAAA